MTHDILPIIQTKGSAGCSMDQTMEAAGISYKTARRLLGLLVKSDKIKQVRTGNAVAYIAAEYYAPKLVIPKGPPGRPRHDIAKISRMGERSANISPDRLAIEKVLAAATGPLQRGVIAEKVGINGNRCANILQRMARDNKARITNTGWISFDYNPKDRIQRELRVCNGSAPNGDIDYWKRYMSSTMSHVRAGAQ
jgi:hypothetical protein